MTTVDHTTLLQRLVMELYNQRNLAMVEACFAPTIQLNGQVFSVAEFREAITQLPSTARRITVPSCGTMGD